MWDKLFIKDEFMYIYALDVSLKNTGAAIFDTDGNLLDKFSIPTSGKDETKDRLFVIGKALSDKLKEYPCELLVMESGFMRFHRATQLLYRCFGVIEYLFHENKQVTYAPTTIKKVITGNGKSDKSIVQQKVLEKFPLVTFNNEDESDAVAIGMTYFIKNRLWEND